MRQKPADGIYKKRLAITFAIGNILDTGSKVIKNQNIAKELSLDVLYILIALIRHIIINTTEKNALGSNIEYKAKGSDSGSVACIFIGKKSHPTYLATTLETVRLFV